jgi:hypothetical protein
MKVLHSMRANLVLIFLFVSFFGWSQDEPIEKLIPTNKTERRKSGFQKKYAPDRKKIRYIVKNAPADILYGNPCMVEETRKMGFEYVIQSRNQPGKMREFARNWNNLITKLRLVLTRSPFWKLILNSRVKDCRRKTGDMVG